MIRSKLYNTNQGFEMNDNYHETVKQICKECKSDFEEEFERIDAKIDANMWTPERAEALAQKVLEDSIPLIEARLLTKLKIGVGEATLDVGKRVLQVIGVAMLALAFWISSNKWPWS